MPLDRRAIDRIDELTSEEDDVVVVAGDSAVSAPAGGHAPYPAQCVKGSLVLVFFVCEISMCCF